VVDAGGISGYQAALAEVRGAPDLAA
jgi:hypothetical protein